MDAGDAAAAEYRDQCERGALMPSAQLLQVFSNLTLRSDGVVEVNASQCIFTKTHFDVFLSVVTKLSGSMLQGNVGRPLRVCIVLRDANIDNGAVLSLANAVDALAGREDVLVVHSIDLADNVNISTVGGKRLRRLCTEYRPLCEVGLNGCSLNAALQRQVEEAAHENALEALKRVPVAGTHVGEPSAARDGDATPDRPATPVEQQSAVRAEVPALAEEVHETTGNRTPQTEPRVSGTNEGTDPNFTASPPDAAKPPGSSGRPDRSSMGDTLRSESKPPTKPRRSGAPPTVDSTERDVSCREGSSESETLSDPHDASMQLHPARGSSEVYSRSGDDPTMISRTLLPNDFGHYIGVVPEQEQPELPSKEAPVPPVASTNDVLSSSAAISTSIGDVPFPLRKSLPYLSHLVQCARRASSSSSPVASLRVSLAPSTQAMLSMRGRGTGGCHCNVVPHLDALLTSAMKPCSS